VKVTFLKLLICNSLLKRSYKLSLLSYWNHRHLSLLHKIWWFRKIDKYLYLRRTNRWPNEIYPAWQTILIRNFFQVKNLKELSKYLSLRSVFLSAALPKLTHHTMFPKTSTVLNQQTMGRPPRTMKRRKKATAWHLMATR
jgi:hypothetical protein